MNNFAQDLIDLAITDMQAVKIQLDRNPNKISQELADEVYNLLEHEYESGHKSVAAIASKVMGEIYDRLNMRYEAVYSFLESLEIEFEVSDSKSYLNLAAASYKISDEAEKLGFYNLSFWGNVLSADCFLNAFKCSDQRSDNRYLLEALQMLVYAARVSTQHFIQRSGDVNWGWFDRFISVTYNCVVLANLKQLKLAIKDPEIFDLLSQISLYLSLLAGILFALAARDNPRAYRLVNILTQLPRSFMSTGVLPSVASYMKASTLDNSTTQIAGLRSLMNKRAQEVRLQYRSRVGRLWISQELDIILCEPLRDALKGRFNPDPSEVFEMVESLKSRLLLDFMGSKFVELPNDKSTLTASERERQALSFKPYNRLREASGLPIFAQPNNESTATKNMVRGSLLSFGTFWDRTERWKAIFSIENFFSYNKAGFNAVEPTPNLFELMKGLATDEVLIEYFIPYHPTKPASEIWILAVTSNELRIVPTDFPWNPDVMPTGVTSRQDGQPVDISPLGVAVSGLIDDITMGKDEEALLSLKKFYQILVSPLIKYDYLTKFRQWIIVPSGILHYLPFAALTDSNNRKLIEDVAITIAPSASVWHKLQIRNKQPVKSFLGLANPVLSYAPYLPPLTETEQEIKKISRILNKLDCISKVRKAASERTLRNLITGKNLIHVATHGEFPESNVIDFHNILLTPTSHDDGRLNAEEIRQLDLKSARLVVLSICNGSLIRFGPGDEPYGLVPAFLEAGAENVLGTLWPLENKLGRDFMFQFYEHLLSDGPASALQSACKYFIEKEALIRHWAVFELVGLGRKF